MNRFLFCLLPALVVISPFSSEAAEWVIEDTSPALAHRESLVYQRKVVKKNGESSFFGNSILQIVWFDSRKADLKVIDNGGGDVAVHGNLAEAMIANGCVAGCNGGFFLKDYSPSGLMISSGKSTGKWGTAKLLSGAVLVGKDGAPRIIRRSEYGGVATELIQAGPFLIDHGSPVKGLSKENPRRRTFVVHDGGTRFGIGICDAFTLQELSEILSTPGVFGEIRIDRALNLDGGTSTGFFYDRGKDYVNVHVEPFKRVRNYLGIVPRR